MANRDSSESRWNDLADALDRMRGDLSDTLREAQRRFSMAVDEPFSETAMQAMATRVAERFTEDVAIRSMLADMVFTSVTARLTDDRWADVVSSEICGLVGESIRTSADQLMTRFNSASIDTRAIRTLRYPLERVTSLGADPLVLDVGAALSEPPLRYERRFGEETICWDVRLETPRTDVLDYALAHSTSFDFSDYDDERIKELLRN